MDRTSWKPKIYKATEAVDYKAEEEGTSDGAKKGWLTRQRGGGSAEEPKKDFVPIDWAGQVGATKSEADQDKASDLMDKYYELVNEPMMDLPEDGSAMEERKAIHAKGVADFKAYLESSGSGTVNQDVRDILEDENYHSLNKMLTKEEPETQSSRDKEFYDESTQNTLDTLNQSKVNGFPFFSYVGQPEKVISDGKGGIILYGMKRNPNSIRRVDVKYDEGRDTYTVSFMSNRNKPKGEYNDVYFDQLGGLIAGNKGLGVESYATEDDYKYDWDQLTSLAQKALSDIGYDKKSWNQEPEDIRKEMEKVAYSEENWKEVANKFYKEELNKGKKNGGEAMYGYGSATGRMSPVEAWNQGADVYGDMGYDQSLRNPIFTDFRGLKWNELPTDIQEAWKSELGYYTQGEGLVDNIEKQLNRFGVNLDRDPEQIEESKANEFNYNVLIKGKPSKEKLRDEFAPYVNIEDDGENTRVIFDGLVDGGKQELESLGYDVIGESKASEADPCWKGYKQIGMKDKNGKQVPNCVPNASESVLEKVHVNGWEFSVIDDGYGGGWADTANTGTYEVGIFAPDDGNPNGQKSAIKGWLTPEEVDDLKRTFEVDPVMAYRRIGGDWEEDWQKGLEAKASEDYFEDEDGNVSSVLKWKLVYEDGSDYGFQTDNKAEAQRAVDQWNETNADKPIKITSNEGFNQGLYGYVDAKCKTCGIEFDSIPDMDDHYAMNPDHVSNLNDLNSDIPNSD